MTKKVQNSEGTQFRTGEKQVHIATLGGIASGKARREKKVGQALMRAVLEHREIDPKIIADLRAQGIDPEEATKEVAMYVRQVEKAIRKGDTPAFKAVLKAAGYDEQKLVLDDQRRTFLVADAEQLRKIADLQNSGL